MRYSTAAIIRISRGFIDENRNAEAAIVIELQEETGYTFAQHQYLGKTYSNPGVFNQRYTFVCSNRRLKKQLNNPLDANEEITVMLKPLEEVKEMVQTYEFKQSMHELCF
jgi:8-oxo-dGTP pyrophosphatase MutT (NUDIX family)